MSGTDYEFYRETDPGKRYELIQQGLLSGEDPERWNAREALFRERYRYDAGEKRYLDSFVTAFVELLVENRRGGRKPGRFGRKQIRKALEKLGPETADGNLREELLFREYQNMAKVYEALCRSSRNYGSLLMGVGSLKPDQITDRILSDLREVAVELPAKAELEEEMALLSRALLAVTKDSGM